MTSKDEIQLYFYDLWMNYGGRPYTPWAAQDDLTDQTILPLAGGDKKSLFYATLFQEYSDNILDKGVKSVHGEKGKLIIDGYSEQSVEIHCDPEFLSLNSYN